MNYSEDWTGKRIKTDFTHGCRKGKVKYEIRSPIDTRLTLLMIDWENTPLRYYILKMIAKITGEYNLEEF